ncbi:hypothetical protein CDV36_010498, partial [Fusarium kuroshium]
MSTTMPNEEHHSSENPRSAARKAEFRRLSQLQKKLDMFYKITEWDDKFMEGFSIIRGSPFNIDDDDPIDLDPRFFLPGPVESMEHGIHITNQTNYTDYCRWPKFQPIDHHLRRQEDQKYANAVSREDRTARWHHYDSRIQGDVDEAGENAAFCMEAGK